MCQRHNLSDVLALLNVLVTAEQKARDIRQMQDDFKNLGLKAHIQLIEFEQDKWKLKHRILSLVEQLTDESELKPDWRTAFLARYHDVSPHQTTAFFWPNEEIQIPETLNLPATPDGTEEHTGFLSYEQKLEFRRLLLLCQDALSVEKYAAAHTHCEQVRTRIDPQSAQLYEYLLLSFIKKEGATAIIRRLLDGIPGGFNHIKLYSDRFNQYQYSHPPQCPSATGSYNQEVAVEEMAAALHSLYSGIHHSAIADTGKRDHSDEQARLMLLRCMDAYFKLYHSLAPVQLFGETLLMELLGGAKFSWIKQIELRSDGVSFICNAPFDLKGKTDELLLMLEKADPHRVPAKQREMIREDLFWSLLDQCELLALQVQEEQRLRHIRTDIRRSVIRIIHAALAGHFLLTRPGDVLEAEKSLLRLAIELLIPNLLTEGGRYDLPEIVLLDWFTLSPQGHLQVEDTGFEYRDFNALHYLQKMIAEHAGEDAWEITRENVRREIWLRYVKATNAIREKVQHGLQFTDFRRIDDFQARKWMLEWLHRTQICFLAYPDTGGPFADSIVEELAGKGLLLWLSIHPDGIVTHSECTLLGCDALSMLQKAVQQSVTWTEETATAAVTESLYQRQLLPEWTTLRAHTEAERPAAARILRCMMTAFNTHPLPLYLDALHHELIREEKFKWIEVDKYGKWLNYSTDLDAVGIILQLTSELPLRYPLHQVKQHLADNRWEEQLKRYDREISTIRPENQLPERRIVADIIWRLKGVFLFWPDRKYLELPLTELNDRGRIAWFDRLFGLVKINQNHYENTLIGFDLKAERVELQRYWDEAFSYASAARETAG